MLVKQYILGINSLCTWQKFLTSLEKLQHLSLNKRDSCTLTGDQRYHCFQSFHFCFYKWIVKVAPFFSHPIKCHDRMVFIKNRIYLVLDLYLWLQLSGKLWVLTVWWFVVFSHFSHVNSTFSSHIDFRHGVTTNTARWHFGPTCFLLLSRLTYREGKTRGGCRLAAPCNGLVEHAAPRTQPHTACSPAHFETQHAMPVHTAQFTSFALCR